MKLSIPVSALATLVVLATTAMSATHPVPLDPKADSSTCLQCHEDKGKGKFVHSAIATGCTSCHEIRVSRDITRVKLIATSPTAVCLSCHADKKASEIKGKVHFPAIRECTKCHDPHSSDNKNQLLLPTSGDSKSTNLCLTCHNQGVDVPKGGSRHAALDMGCDTCHVTHKTGELGKQEFDFHLTKNSPALCLDCHDTKDASLQKAHDGQPFATANCVQCHNPHQSAAPKLMQKFTHMPFAAGGCDSCHKAAKDGKVDLVNSDTRALCLTCHSDVGEKMDKAKVQHPGAMGECTACHNPHAGRNPRFIQPDPVNACLACHSDQAEQMKKAHLHQPAFQQGCATCHEAHGGDNEHLLRAATPNKLCLECHGPDAKPAKADVDHMVTIFNGSVLLPDDYFSKVPVLPLKYNMGHPVQGHPVSDFMDPNDVTKVKTKINCLTCHQPHSSAQPGLLVKDQTNSTAFCATCHTRLVR